MDEKISDQEVVSYLSRKVLKTLEHELGKELPVSITIASLSEAMMKIAKAARVCPKSFKEILQSVVIDYVEY